MFSSKNRGLDVMKVAFFIYPSAFQNKGGGEILLENTEKYLIKAGIDVKRFDMWNDKIEDFDILHVFGSVKECLPLMEVAKSRKVKVVLESIFWSDFRRAFCETGSSFKKLEMVLRHLLKVLFPFLNFSRRKMFRVSDMIVPNSPREAAQISRLFAVSSRKMFVVPNGVDADYINATSDLFVKKYGLKDFILYVGRIEPRKNQLNLIRAVRGLDKELVLVGSVVSGYEWYLEKCKIEAGKNVHFLGGFENNSPLLKSAYAACGIFVLPGWFETPGLAALEAALAGAKLVVTDGGSTREYFKDMAEYIRPDSPKDIAHKIRKVTDQDKNDKLKNFVLNNYTWEKVAARTIEGYKKVLQ
ncbi:MAG: glycosyltransferase [Candidatus Omnitrophica bacterium]|nr:glycosyltransferase [Candidatus Omnitrophota bacterium]